MKYSLSETLILYEKYAKGFYTLRCSHFCHYDKDLSCFSCIYKTHHNKHCDFKYYECN